MRVIYDKNHLVKETVYISLLIHIYFIILDSFSITDP